MTKQEEIREEIAGRCFENCDGATQGQCDKLNKQYDGVDACRYCGADQVLKYLHSQGAVIKVERELTASICGYCECLDSCQETHSECDKFKLEAGYVAWVPLVEVPDG